MFLKVRSSDGPKHVFYAPVGAVELWPDDYIVIDKNPVAQPGPFEYADIPKSNHEKAASIKSSVGKTIEGEG